MRDRRGSVERIVDSMLQQLVVHLPSLRIGHVLGRALYFLDIPHHRVVRRNLAFAYPEFSDSQRRSLARRVFQNYGVNLVELFQLGFMRPEDIARRVRLYGIENFRQAFLQKRGVIAVSGHMGSWEFGDAGPAVHIWLESHGRGEEIQVEFRRELDSLRAHAVRELHPLQERLARGDDENPPAGRGTRHPDGHGPPQGRRRGPIFRARRPPLPRRWPCWR